jgi:hypothetical protein
MLRVRAEAPHYGSAIRYSPPGETSWLGLPGENISPTIGRNIRRRRGRLALQNGIIRIIALARVVEEEGSIAGIAGRVVFAIEDLGFEELTE